MIHDNKERALGEQHPNMLLYWNGRAYVSFDCYEAQRARGWEVEQGKLPPIDSALEAWDDRRERFVPMSMPEPAAVEPLQELIATLLCELENVPAGGALRGGLMETPARAAKAWRDWTRGYGMDPAAVLKTFEDGAQGCDEMVVVQDIPVYSHCEHHLAPIFGTVTIGYLPDKRIVGLSKLSRLADIYARRLQVQERMTNQIADALTDHLHPHGCGVVMRARHLCMESRGVQQAGTVTTTSAMRGMFREDARVRAEFLALAHTRGA